MPPDTNDEKDRALDLSWNQIAQDRPGTAGGLDPADAAMIRYLHSFDDRPGPEPGFVRQLREDLMNAHALPVSSTPSPRWLPNGHTHDPQRRPAVPSAPRPGTRRLAFAQVAVALLFVLVAGYLGYRALGPGDPERPRTVPAAVAPAGTPSPTSAADDRLLTVELPAEMLPHGDLITGSLHNSIIPGGSTTAWTTELGACCLGIRIDYVLQGSYVVRADGPVQVVRAGGNGHLETIAGDIEIRLDPGDALIFPNQTAVEYANRWASEAELLTWVLYDYASGQYNDDPIPPGFVMSRTTLRFDQTIPPGPATLRLQRIELAGKTILDAPDGVLQFGVLTSELAHGTPTPRDVGYLEDGTVRNFGADPVIAYVMTLTPAGLDGADPVANSGP